MIGGGFREPFRCFFTVDSFCNFIVTFSSIMSQPSPFESFSARQQRLRAQIVRQGGNPDTMKTQDPGSTQQSLSSLLQPRTPPAASRGAGLGGGAGGSIFNTAAQTHARAKRRRPKPKKYKTKTIRNCKTGRKITKQRRDEKGEIHEEEVDEVIDVDVQVTDHDESDDDSDGGVGLFDATGAGAAAGAGAVGSGPSASRESSEPDLVDQIPEEVKKAIKYFMKKENKKPKKLTYLFKSDPQSWRLWRAHTETVLEYNGFDHGTACQEIMCAIIEQAREALGTFEPYTNGYFHQCPDTGNITKVAQTPKELLDRLEQQVFMPIQSSSFYRLALKDVHQESGEVAMVFGPRYRRAFLLAKPHLVQQEEASQAAGGSYSVNTDPDLIYGFINGLRDSRVAEKVRDALPTTPGDATLDMAIQTASLKEATIWETSQRGQSRVSKPKFLQELGLLSGGSSSKTSGTASNPFGLQSVSTENNDFGGDFKGTCHICDLAGHTGRNCPLYKKVTAYQDKFKNKGRGKGFKKGKKREKNVSSMEKQNKNAEGSGNDEGPGH